MARQREGGIAWCDDTWNPIRGCSRVSTGCEHCYAERVAARFCAPGLPYEGLAMRGKNGPRWTGAVRLVWGELLAPLHWRKPRRVFVNSMSDLFHEQLTDKDIDLVFATMLACEVLENMPGHRFQILTKRPERMRTYLSAGPAQLLERWAKAADGRVILDNADVYFSEAVYSAVSRRWDDNGRAASDHKPWGFPEQLFPLKNVWLGVSTENQATADERIPQLVRTPAAVRFVSCEPLLGPIDLSDWLYEASHCRACGHHKAYYDANPTGLPIIHECVMGVGVTGEPGAIRCMACHSLEIDELNGLQWVIAGSESGPGARPMEEEWARLIKNQCVLANVPYFFKQNLNPKGKKVSLPMLDGRRWDQFPGVRHD